MSNAQPMEKPLRIGTILPSYGRVCAVMMTGGERYYWLVKDGYDVAMLPWSVVEPLAPVSAEGGEG